MANTLPPERRLEVLAALVNGTSARAASRLSGAHQDTVGKLLQQVGDGCARLHNRLVRDLTCSLVDLDEQHSWVRKRQKNVDPERDDVSIMGEQWTWAAICRSSKLIISWHIGKRDQLGADTIVADVRSRLVVMPQITTDGLGLYESAILKNFGYGVPYAQTVKRFSSTGGGDGTAEKYAVPSGVDFIEKRVIFGAPDLTKSTTYAIERNNLTARLWNARLNRRTLAYSKKVERHAAAASLFYMHGNFCHIPRTQRATPAMLAGVTDHVWSLAELMEAALAEPAGEKPEPKPLVIPKPESTARALPNGRGWLQVVKGGDAPAAPAPAPPTPPEAPAVQLPAVASSGAPVATVEPTAAPTAHDRQLDLFAWRPKPREPRQLSLFGGDESRDPPTT